MVLFSIHCNAQILVLNFRPDNHTGQVLYLPSGTVLYPYSWQTMALPLPASLALILAHYKKSQIWPFVKYTLLSSISLTNTAICAHKPKLTKRNVIKFYIWRLTKKDTNMNSLSFIKYLSCQQFKVYYTYQSVLTVTTMTTIKHHLAKLNMTLDES